MKSESAWQQQGKLNSELRNDADAGTIKPVHRHQCGRRFVHGDVSANEFLRRKLSCRDHRQHYIIAMRLHSMRTKHLQFVGDDFGHRDFGRGMFTRHQSCLHMAAATAQARD